MPTHPRAQADERVGAKAMPGKPSLHPHDLRHAFVTLDGGAALRHVQDAAGHASANITRR